jgi:putative membrane protein
MKEYIVYFTKGVAVGVANIIPGVSGGTIALITGIFERLINAIKSFDLKALRLLLKGEWKAFVVQTDFYFLVALFSGGVIAIVSLAQIFDFLFRGYPVYIWSFFFGLILASVYFVGKTVERWRTSVYISFVIGTAIALMFTFLTPASENSGFLYLVLCGVVAVCSMILPGLSGSFVLILMGNYQLVAIEAINNRDLSILFPVLIGAVGGLIAFSHLLSWVFKSYKDQTISLLTGFILGSLGVIWPWKNAIEQTFGEKVKVVGYDYFFPQMNIEFFIAVVVIIVGIAAIWWMEKNAEVVSAGHKPETDD